MTCRSPEIAGQNPAASRIFRDHLDRLKRLTQFRGLGDFSFEAEDVVVDFGKRPLSGFALAGHEIDLVGGAKIEHGLVGTLQITLLLFGCGGEPRDRDFRFGAILIRGERLRCLGIRVG